MAKRTPVTQSQFELDVYQDLPVVKSSTTSRVVLDNALLRVVDFTFDAGEMLTDHSSPRAVVVRLLEGEMTFILDGDKKLLHAGDIVYLAPGVNHALTAETACRLTLTMVDVSRVSDDILRDE